MKQIILQRGQYLILVSQSPQVPQEPVRELTKKEYLAVEYKQLLCEVKKSRTLINIVIQSAMNNTCVEHKHLVQKMVDDNLDLLSQLRKTESNIKQTYVSLVKNL